MSLYFEILGELEDVEVIAVGSAIREIGSLRKRYGKGRWRKLKGVAKVLLTNGNVRLAEIHWYEAHGIGQRKLKLKSFLD